MNKEQIVRELRDLLDCTSFGHIRKDIQNLINKLQPKPLFVPGPAKLRNGEDAEIYKIFDDCIHGYYVRDSGSIMIHSWNINGLRIGNTTTKSDIDLLPNNNEPVDKIVDDIKKDATEGERKVIIYKDYVTQEAKEADEDIDYTTCPCGKNGYHFCNCKDKI